MEEVKASFLGSRKECFSGSLKQRKVCVSEPNTGVKLMKFECLS